MRTRHLHIGRHKTGSTSIQTLMENERHVFLENGIYPVRRSDFADLKLITRETKRTKTNLYDVANLIIRADLMNGPRMRGVVPARNPDQVRRMAKAVNKRLHSLPENEILMLSLIHI